MLGRHHPEDAAFVPFATGHHLLFARNWLETGDTEISKTLLVPGRHSPLGKIELYAE